MSWAKLLAWWLYAQDGQRQWRRVMERPMPPRRFFSHDMVLTPCVHAAQEIVAYWGPQG